VGRRRRARGLVDRRSRTGLATVGRDGQPDGHGPADHRQGGGRRRLDRADPARRARRVPRA
jgi:hypothetical protein